MTELHRLRAELKAAQTALSHAKRTLISEPRPHIRAPKSLEQDNNLLKDENKVLRDAVDGASVEIGTIIELRVELNSFYEKVSFPLAILPFRRGSTWQTTQS